MTKQEIIVLIGDAWKNVQIPRETEIAKHNLTYDHCEEMYVRKFFSGKTWDSIRFADLVREYPGAPDACLAFMAAKGVHYFLPTFMMINLAEGEAADTAAYSAECAIYAIARENPNSLFTTEQCAAIKAYLEFVKGTALSYFETNREEFEAALRFFAT